MVREVQNNYLYWDSRTGPEDSFEYRNFKNFNFEIEKFNFNFEKQSGELKTKWGTKKKVGN